MKKDQAEEGGETEYRIGPSIEVESVSFSYCF